MFRTLVIHKSFPCAVNIAWGIKKQRRPLGNIANAAGVRLAAPPGVAVGVPSGGVPAGGVQPQGPPPPQPKVPFAQQATAVRVAAVLAKSAQSAAAAAAAAAAGGAGSVAVGGGAVAGLGGPPGAAGGPCAAPRAQFYGHNPNLKLPPELCLLGCVFHVAEYGERQQTAREVPQWVRAMRDLGGEVEVTYCGRVTHVLCETQLAPAARAAQRDGKRCVTAFWLNDVVLRQQVLPPWQALHLPTPFGDENRPLRGQILSLSGFEGAERQRVAYMVETAGARLTRYFSPHNNALICKRPDGVKYRKAREWGRPVANVQWLSDLLLGQAGVGAQIDQPKYQQFSLGNPFRIELTLVPQLMAAWKAPINITQEAFERARAAIPASAAANRLRAAKRARLDAAAAAAAAGIGMGGGAVGASKAASVRDQENQALLMLEEVPITNPNPPPPEQRPVVMFSAGVAADLPRKARQLGCALAARKCNATHLVMPHLSRTSKFMCAVSVCQFIVSEQWILDSYSQNTLLDEQPYLLEDAEFEMMYRCNVPSLLKKPNRHELLKGKVFYLTPSVVPPPRNLTEIIECAGGTVDRRYKPTKLLPEAARNGNQHIVIAAESDVQLLNGVEDYPIYNSEWILTSILQQELLFISKEESKENTC